MQLRESDGRFIRQVGGCEQVQSHKFDTVQRVPVDKSVMMGCIAVHLLHTV